MVGWSRAAVLEEQTNYGVFLPAVRQSRRWLQLAAPLGPRGFDKLVYYPANKAVY